MTIKEKANELCNDPKNDWKSTEDLCVIMGDTLIEKAIEWLKDQEEIIGISFQEDFIERFKYDISNKL